MRVDFSRAPDPRAETVQNDLHGNVVGSKGFGYAYAKLSTIGDQWSQSARTARQR
jgi:hypothetical protein